jgi:hypothetical protein
MAAALQVSYYNSECIYHIPHACYISLPTHPPRLMTIIISGKGYKLWTQCAVFSILLSLLPSSVQIFPQALCSVFFPKTKFHTHIQQHIKRRKVSVSVPWWSMKLLTCCEKLSAVTITVQQRLYRHHRDLVRKFLAATEANSPAIRREVSPTHPQTDGQNTVPTAREDRGSYIQLQWVAIQFTALFPGQSTVYFICGLFKGVDNISDYTASSDMMISE